MRRAFAVILVLLILWGIASLAAKGLNEINFSVTNSVVMIPIHGIITIGNSELILSEEQTTSNAVISYLDKADKDPSVKGVILEINSGGGNVVASKEIANRVKAMKKPVVAWIREVGASGAYWVASAADKIVADSLSVTGSIGVRSSYLEFSGLMEMYGVKYESLTGGKYKDSGSPYKEMTNEERALWQSKIDIIHTEFIKEVNENRGKNLGEYATGMFYLGKEAEKIGMIDYLGSKDKVVEVIKELTGVKEVNIVVYKQKTSVLNILERFTSKFGDSIGSAIGDSFKTEEKLKMEA